MMIQEMVNLLYTTIVNDVFGSALLFGLFILGFFIYFILRSGLSLWSMFPVLLFLLVFLASYTAITGIPFWVISVIIIVCGILLSLFFLRLVRR